MSIAFNVLAMEDKYSMKKVGVVVATIRRISTSQLQTGYDALVSHLWPSQVPADRRV